MKKAANNAYNGHAQQKLVKPYMRTVMRDAKKYLLHENKYLKFV